MLFFVYFVIITFIPMTNIYTMKQGIRDLSPNRLSGLYRSLFNSQSLPEVHKTNEELLFKTFCKLNESVYNNKASLEYFVKVLQGIKHVHELHEVIFIKMALAFNAIRTHGSALQEDHLKGMIALFGDQFKIFYVENSPEKIKTYILTKLQRKQIPESRRFAIAMIGIDSLLFLRNMIKDFSESFFDECSFLVWEHIARLGSKNRLIVIEYIEEIYKKVIFDTFYLDKNERESVFMQWLKFKKNSTTYIVDKQRLQFKRSKSLLFFVQHNSKMLK